jgi:hypothetical protein
MTCPYLKETTNPVCVIRMEHGEVFAPDPTTLKVYCRYHGFPECGRHFSSPVQEEMMRVFG